MLLKLGEVQTYLFMFVYATCSIFSIRFITSLYGMMMTVAICLHGEVLKCSHMDEGLFGDFEQCMDRCLANMLLGIQLFR